MTLASPPTAPIPPDWFAGSRLSRMEIQLRTERVYNMYRTGHAQAVVLRQGEDCAEGIRVIEWTLRNSISTGFSGGLYG